jgi:zinc transport system substrate-binding protein
MGRHFCCAGFLFLLLSLAFSACGQSAPYVRSDGKLAVVASILPLADFARQVGGNRIDVVVLVPAGASPHTYEPTPAQLLAVARARVLVLNGVGLEFWAEKVISSAGNPDLKVVTVSEGVKIIAGDPDEPGGNPHTWLSPVNAMRGENPRRTGVGRSGLGSCLPGKCRCLPPGIACA